MRWRLRPSQVIASFALAVVVGTAMGVMTDTPSSPPPSPTTSVDQQPPADNNQDALEPTDLQTVKANLGPFVVLGSSNSPTPDTHAPAVLLCNPDGSTFVSTTWQVPFVKTEWVQKSSDLIAVSSPVNTESGYITFSAGVNQVFTVKIGQAFVLAARPQYVMRFDEFGQQWQLSADKAFALKARY